MPSRLAASMIVVLAGTSIGLPSISRFTFAIGLSVPSVHA